MTTRGLSLGLFGLSLLLRLAYRNAGLFHYDSVVLAQALESTVETGRLHGQVNGRYGSVVVNLLLYIPYRLATGTESAEQTVILTNILCAALGTVALFWLLRALLADEPAAFFSAFTFSVSPIFLSVTTTGKPHGLEVLLVTAALLCLASARKQQTKFRWAAASLLMGFAVLSREAVLGYLPLYLLLFLNPTIRWQRPFFSVDRTVLRPAALALGLGLLAAIVVVAYFAYLDDVIVRTWSPGGRATVTFAGFLSPVLPLALGDLHRDLSSVGAALAVAGAWLTWSRSPNKFPGFFLISWAALILYFGNTTAYRPGHLVVVSIAFFAFLGVALAWTYRSHRIIGGALALGLAGALFFEIQPVIAHRSRVSGGKAHALWLQERVPAGSVIVAMDDSPFIEYYAGLPTRSHPYADPVAIDAWMEETRALVERGDRVYIISSGFSYDPGSHFRRALGRHFRLRKVGEKPTEDYHRAEIEFRRYRSRLFELVPKSNRGAEPFDRGP